MSKPQDRTVSQRPDGSWANKRNDAGKASSLHATQAAAVAAGKAMLGNQGRGEITVQGVNGQFRQKDTVAPGNDPTSSKG